MQVQISLKPIHPESHVRGVGIYTRELSQALRKNYPQDHYYLATVSHHKIDLLHYPYFEPFFLTLGFFHLHPFIVTIHDLIPLKYPTHCKPGVRGNFKWKIQKLLIKRAAHIITDSSASSVDIQKILSIPPRKISVIPLAPSFLRSTVKINDSVRAEYKLPSRFALYVGDVNWNKNIPGLIREFSRLENNTLHLVLVGKAFTASPPTPELLSIKEAIVKSGVEHKIHILGYVPNHHLPAIYCLATLYIQPSFDEGFGFPLLEAMSSSCPVISSNRGSLPEVGGRAVQYFDPGKPGDLSEKISLLSRSPSLREELIARGHTQLKKYSWDQTAKLTHEVYEKILGINS
ncbi:MAG: glycosyltransferase family 1 protein [bacterium]